MRLQVATCTAVLALHSVMSKADPVRAPGKPTGGLQAALIVEQQLARRLPIQLELELCNVVDRPILLDAWVGYWFVDLQGTDGNRAPHTRAIDVLRAGRPNPEWLAPGLCWKTRLESLRLVDGLPPSSPLWEYEPLEVGEYVFQGEFTTWSVVSSVLEWRGKAVSGSARVFLR